MTLLTHESMDEQQGNITSKNEQTNSEIVENFQSFRDFLKKMYGISDNDIPAIKYIINKDEELKFMPESCSLFERLDLYNDNTIKSLIWANLLEKYSYAVDDGKCILSAYLIKSIIDEGDFHQISHVTNLFYEFHCNIGPSGLKQLSLIEIKEILEKLISYYNDYNNKNMDSIFAKSNIKVIKELKKILESLEYINSSKNQMDFLEGRIKYYLSEYGKLQHNDKKIDGEEDEHLVEIIFALINSGNSKFNCDLFFKLKNYPELCEDVMGNIDKFEGLDDSDYIDLYFRLYPERKTEYLEPKTDENINICVNQINNMSKDEFEDFMDLVKTTHYWTDDVCSKCYEKAKAEGMWRYIMDNYAMGYFNFGQDVVDKELVNNVTGLRQAETYLPIVTSENCIGEIIKTVKNDGRISFSSISRGYKLMENRKTLNDGGRGIIRPSY